MAAKKPVTIEHALANLEQLIQQMDSGELELEQSLLAFEKGIALIRECQQTLQSAEQKVQMLTANATGLHVTPLQQDAN